MIVSVCGAMVLAAPAFAATTASFSPANIQATAGNNFAVTITVNPQGASDYAEKLEVRYPADTLEVKSFTLANVWMALTQPGYDSIDNTAGVLVKSAGYPGGFSSLVPFGTVSFYAKKAGIGTITIGDHSLAFEANSQSALHGAPASFSIVVVPVTASKNPAPKENPPVRQNAAPKNPVVTPPKQQGSITPAPASQSVPAGQPQSRSLLAAVGALLTMGSGNALVGILVLLIILALIAYGIYFSMQRKRKQ